jgi:hypothetical protein
MKSVSDYQHLLIVLKMKLYFKVSVSSVRPCAPCTEQLPNLGLGGGGAGKDAAEVAVRFNVLFQKFTEPTENN